MTLTTSGCPICRSGAISLAYKVTRGDLSSQPIYNVSCCSDCGHLWAEGESSKELFSEIYSRYFYGTSQQSAPHNPDGSLKPEAENYPPLVNARQRVTSLTAAGMRGTLLDVGCGVGYFVLAAKDDFDAEGLEIEQTAVDQAALIGARVRLGDALVQEENPKRYDVVTLWDVFSGFTEPQETAARLLDRVADGGRLVLTMPDAGSLVARLARARWPLMIPPGNMQFYTEASARRLFAGLGATDVTITRPAKLVSVSFLVHKGLRAFGFYRAAKWRLPIPPDWKIPLNLGDIMTVTVRKPRASVGPAA
ncbi:class I SAM-dependent methyltransferase [Bosea vestrisii]|uniref:class I SAM-dependent methyltransferase n=1 Tax=Bosea vestrisii TaxID=151416 RepID=UPI0024E02DA0|nr:class I SAM-dependent methyltransferase [Bosea vestrisii]WID98768.1 class I SAM-dependent methyltransferase [Bosea vestrisii]